jgi:hypothetical protein
MLYKRFFARCTAPISSATFSQKLDSSQIKEYLSDHYKLYPRLIGKFVLVPYSSSIEHGSR